MNHLKLWLFSLYNAICSLVIFDAPSEGSVYLLLQMSLKRQIPRRTGHPYPALDCALLTCLSLLLQIRALLLRALRILSTVPIWNPD